MIQHFLSYIFLPQPKCDLYWPDAGSETYGDLVVTLVREDVLASYTLRTFTIRKIRASQDGHADGHMSKRGKSSKNKKHVKRMKKDCLERTVYQYHFTAWPDHGVPLHTLPLVTFVRNSSNANPTDGGPIVVHCRFVCIKAIIIVYFS